MQTLIPLYRQLSVAHRLLHRQTTPVILRVAHLTLTLQLARWIMGFITLDTLVTSLHQVSALLNDHPSDPFSEC